MNIENLVAELIDTNVGPRKELTDKKDYVVFSGGSGNKQLLRSLLLDKEIDPRNMEIIINMYDDGKSTGICRDRFEILGPSDLRKNHATLGNIIYGPDGIVEKYLNDLKKKSEDPDNADKDNSMDHFISCNLYEKLFKYRLVNKIMSYRISDSQEATTLLESHYLNRLDSYNQIMSYIDKCFEELYNEIAIHNTKCKESNTEFNIQYYTHIVNPDVQCKDDCIHYSAYKGSSLYYFFKDMIRCFLLGEPSSVLLTRDKEYSEFKRFTFASYTKDLNAGAYGHNLVRNGSTLTPDEYAELYKMPYYSMDSFSIGNMVYSVLMETAKICNDEDIYRYPVKATSEFICESLFNIPNIVSTISETNKKIHGLAILDSENEIHLPTEASIVDFGKSEEAKNHSDSYISDIFCSSIGQELDFTSPGALLHNWPSAGLDRFGQSVDPRIAEIIKNAKHIIISSGTFWSSLYPTFAHTDFKELIKNKEVTVIANRFPDYDMLHVKSNEYISVIAASLLDDLDDLTNNPKIEIIIDSSSEYYNDFNESDIDSKLRSNIKITKRSLSLKSDNNLHNVAKLAKVLP